MSVLIETTDGNFVIDVSYKENPVLAFNFIKLCSIKYFFFSPFFGLVKDTVVYGGLPQFPDRDSKGISEFMDDADKTKHQELIDQSSINEAVQEEEASVGVVSFVLDDKEVKSQFSILLAPEIPPGIPFGKVAEGFDTLLKLNEKADIRILHTHILHDPFPDIASLKAVTPADLVPSESQIADVFNPDTNIEALTLELIGDLPRYDIKPSPSVLFIAKLNPITTSESLEIIFSRFGSVTNCTVVKDKSGDSKRYGFVKFATEREAEIAYENLHQGCIIDGKEVVIDFSQSTRKSE